MASRFLGKRSFTVGVSGTFRVVFGTESSPSAAFMLVRHTGTQDASYKVFTTNFDMDDMDGVANSGDLRQQLTGSAYRKYWYAEPGASGSAFTGSATIPPDPFMMHFVDIGSRMVMVEVSSSAGGPFILSAFGKSWR